MLRFLVMVICVGLAAWATGCGRLGLHPSADARTEEDGDVADASDDAATDASTDADLDASTHSVMDAATDAAMDAGPECVIDSDCDGRGLCPFGVCAMGSCVAAPTSQEVCDGLDNDCDQLVDEAAALDSLCPSGEACLSAGCQTLDPALMCQAFQSGADVFAHCGVVATFDEAVAHCASIGATLATASTPERDQVLRDFTLATGDDAWIGLRRSTPLCEWQWVTGEPVNFTNWGTGLPNGNCGAADCAQYWSGASYAWDDTGCNRAQAFLCEWANP